jgi:hypothetical protein
MRPRMATIGGVLVTAVLDWALIPCAHAQSVPAPNRPVTDPVSPADMPPPLPMPGQRAPVDTLQAEQSPPPAAVLPAPRPYADSPVTRPSSRSL